MKSFYLYAQIVMDCLGLLYVQLAGIPLYRWGVFSDNWPPTWAPNLDLVDSWCVLEEHRERWSSFPWMALLVAFGRDVQMVYHLRAEEAVQAGGAARRVDVGKP